jgi:hypothetical protein
METAWRPRKLQIWMLLSAQADEEYGRLRLAGAEPGGGGVGPGMTVRTCRATEVAAASARVVWTCAAVRVSVHSWS